MLSLFTTCKIFWKGFDTYQRNALVSWTLIEPRPDIIVFGNEKGVVQVAEHLGIRSILGIERNEFGMPRLDDMFVKAQRHAANDIIGYVNADIMIVSGFAEAIQSVAATFDSFLVVGRRWDIPRDTAFDFSGDWREQARLAIAGGEGLYTQCGSDFFVFRRPLFELPPLAAGCPGWDNWMIWKATQEHIPIVDITDVATVAHPRHGYGDDGQNESCRAAWKAPKYQFNKKVLARSKTYQAGLEFGTREAARAGNLWRVIEVGIVKG